VSLLSVGDNDVAGLNYVPLGKLTVVIFDAFVLIPTTFVY